MKKQIKYIYSPGSKIEKEQMTIYGAGKFGESTLIIDKDRALLLLIELYRFLEKELSNKT